MMHVAWVAIGLLLATHPAGADEAPAPADELAPEAPAEPAPTSPDEPATTLAPVPAAAVAPPVPANDDIDLSALGLDPAGGVPFDDKLNLYGFVDFNWTALRWSKRNPFVSDNTSFGIGSVNLYLAKNLTRAWRSLVELRIVFAPNGSRNADGTITNTAAQDFQDFGRPVQWSGVSLERAYLEYDLDPRLTIRVGHWLTPYGIWNIDHGSPTIIAADRPFVIGEQMFPEHQTGIDLFGATHVGRFRFGYHATVSNGRSPTEVSVDLDSTLAYGGRLDLETAVVGGTAKFGVSGYMGRYTNLAPKVGAVAESYEEVAFGADVQWDRGGLHAQGELILQDRDYREGHRSVTAGGFMPNGRNLGMYGLVGYRFNRAWQVMPFAFVQHYKPLEKLRMTGVDSITAGLNFRPIPTVVLKLQAAHGRFGDGGLLDGQTLTIFTTQAAWVF